MMKSITLSTFGIAAILSKSAQACSIKSGVKITFFGFPDNDPPSGQISYNCGRGFTAGGTGTYNDPITFAAATNGPFSRCEVVYIPYLQKYGRFEDYCGQCGKDWNNQGLLHIDIWTGSPNANGGNAQENCENKLTRTSKHIIKSPGQNLQVDPRPLFQGGTCSTGNVYEDSGVSELCSGDRSSSQSVPLASTPGGGSQDSLFSLGGLAFGGNPSGGNRAQGNLQNSPSQSNPSQGDPTQGHPSQSDPSQSDPSQSDPSQADPTQGNPNASPSDPSQADSTQGNPNASPSDPSQADPAQGTPQANPSQIDPSQVDPALGNPAQSDPPQVDPTQGNPSQADPAQGNPNPSQSDPSQVDPAQGNPSQRDPTQGDPTQGDLSQTDSSQGDLSQSDFGLPPSDLSSSIGEPSARKLRKRRSARRNNMLML